MTLEKIKSKILKFAKSHHFIVYDSENSDERILKLLIINDTNDINDRYITLRITYNEHGEYLYADDIYFNENAIRYTQRVQCDRVLDFLSLLYYDVIMNNTNVHKAIFTAAKENMFV